MGNIVRFGRRWMKVPKARNPWGRRRNMPWLLLSMVIVGASAGYFLFDLSRPSPDGQSDAIRTAAIPAEAIVGRASVIDGDTLEIHGTRIRLHGIDAPESSQSCSMRGSESRCGQQAALALTDRIGSGVVSCEPRDRDQYNRVVAVCRANDKNLNAWMVASGWALAYRHYSLDYVQEEETAAAAKRGIWQGEFVPPWDWRRGKRLEIAETQPEKDTQRPQTCLIKGNISARGERIYHVPGGEYYDPTRINTSKGERWFCSEEEALAAGWRRSRR